MKRGYKTTGYSLDIWLRRLIALRKEMELMIEDGRIDSVSGARIIGHLHQASGHGHHYRNFSEPKALYDE